MSDIESIKDIYDPYDDDDKPLDDAKNIRYIFSNALHTSTLDGILEKEKTIAQDVKIAHSGSCFFEGDSIKNSSAEDDILTLQQKNTMNELMTYYNMFEKDEKEDYTLFDFKTSDKPQNPKHLLKFFGSTYRELPQKKYLLVGNKKVKTEPATNEAENYLFSEGMKLTFKKSPIFNKKNKWSTNHLCEFNFSIGFKHRLTNKYTTINVVITNSDTYADSKAKRQLRRLSGAVGASWEPNDISLGKIFIDADKARLFNIAGNIDTNMYSNGTFTFDGFEYIPEDGIPVGNKLIENDVVNLPLSSSDGIFTDPSNITMRVEKITDENAVILSYGLNHPDFIKIDNIPDDKFNERDEDDSFIFTGQIPTISQLYRYTVDQQQQLTYKDTKVRFKLKNQAETLHKCIEMDNNGCFGERNTDKDGSTTSKFVRFDDMTINLKKIIEAKDTSENFLTISFGQTKLNTFATNKLSASRSFAKKYELTGKGWNPFSYRLQNRLRKTGKNIVRPIITGHKTIELKDEPGTELSGTFEISESSLEKNEKGLMGLARRDGETLYYKIRSISHLKQIMASVKEIAKDGTHKQKYGEYFRAEAYFYKLLRVAKIKTGELFKKNTEETLFKDSRHFSALDANVMYLNYIQSKYYNTILFLRSLGTTIGTPSTTLPSPDEKFYQMQLYELTGLGWVPVSTEQPLADKLIDNQLDMLGLPPRAYEYRVLKHISTKTKSKAEYGILFCGKVYSLKYKPTTEGSAKKTRRTRLADIFPKSLNTAKRHTTLNFFTDRKGAEKFASTFEEFTDALNYTDETTLKSFHSWIYEKFCAIFRSHLKPSDKPGKIFTRELDEKSFDMDIADWKKVLPTSPTYNFIEEVAGFDTLFGVSYSGNKIFGEFGYVKFEEDGKDNDNRYTLTINSNSTPMLVLKLRRPEEEEVEDKMEQNESGSNTNGANPDQGETNNSKSWESDENQLGFEANEVENKNIFLNMWKGIKGAFKSKNSAHSHENEFVPMNKWYDDIRWKTDSMVKKGFTREITMKFTDGNIKCENQEVSWDTDATARSNEKINALFMLNQYIFCMLYELSSKYIKVNTELEDDIDFKNANARDYQTLSNIWKYFEDNEDNDDVTLDKDLEISKEQLTVKYKDLENLFNFGFEFSEIYPKNKDNSGYKSTTDIKTEIEVANYSTNVTFEIKSADNDASWAKNMTSFYTEKYKYIDEAIRTTVDDELDSKYVAKLYTIYTRRYVAVIEKKREEPPVYFEAYILETMNDAEWEIESIIGWGTKGLVLNVEENKKIFLKFMTETPEKEIIGLTILKTLSTYAFTIEDSRVITTDNKEQFFLSRLLRNFANYEVDTIQIIKGGKCIPFPNKNDILSGFVANIDKKIEKKIKKEIEEKIKEEKTGKKIKEEVLKLIMGIVVYMFFTLLHGNNYIDYDVLSIEQFLAAGKHLSKKIGLQAEAEDEAKKLANYMKVANGPDKYWVKMCTAEKNALRDIVMGIEEKTDVQNLLKKRDTYCACLSEFEPNVHGVPAEHFMDEVLIPHLSKERTWKHLDNTPDRQEDGQGGETKRTYKSQYRYYLYQDLINYMKYITIKTLMPINHRFDCFFDKFCYLCDKIIEDHEHINDSIFLNKFLLDKYIINHITPVSAADNEPAAAVDNEPAADGDIDPVSVSSSVLRGGSVKLSLFRDEEE
jgi:hypothetical protein